MTPKEFKQLRKSLNHTQSGMALALGVTRRSVQRYEAGAQPIEGAVLKVCEYMKGNTNDN